TMFSEGLEEGTCSYCEETLTKTVDKESAKIHTFTTDVRHNYSDYYYFDSILDGGHFYPTEENRNGQSLYIEYSMLWSEEFVNASIGQDYMLLGRFDPQDGYDVNNYDIAYALAIGPNVTWTDPKIPGYFDVLGKNLEVVSGNYTYGSDVANCPSIGGYGWHRIGIVIKQIDNSRLNATLYIDGVKLSSHNFEPRNKANLLYTVENGEYKDIDLTRCITPYYFGDTNTVGGTADFEIADLYVTAGTDFVLTATKLTDPRRVTYTDLDGTEHTDITYFGYGDDIPGEPIVPDEPDTPDEPEACTHPNAEYVTTKVNTMFSEGLEEGFCPDCDEPVSRNIPKTEITTQVVTSTSGHDEYRWFYECHFLKDLVSEDNHFYDENNSLFIEYSILINESFDATIKKGANYGAWFILGTIGNTSGDDNTLNKIGWLHRDTKDGACPYVGGVEPNGTVTKFYENNGIVEQKGDFYAMKEALYYGWHRIGVQINQTHEGKGDNAEYTVTATIFIDGERIMDMTYDSWKTENLLYTVDEDGVCHDNDNSEIEVTAFVLQRLIPKNSSDKIYIPVADTYVTCGTGFVMPVKKLDTPIEDTYSPASGVTLDADHHFAYVD
ncbi:MAG: hypothetical protein IKV20_03665, partial [Clostridia bacterium]|nr:hypothetical protein [Clostridia bacterium]